MLQLDRVRKRAQYDANRTGDVVVILNLNPFHPLYVIRSWREGLETSKEYVETVRPSREAVLVYADPTNATNVQR